MLWKALHNIIYGKIFSEYFLMSIAAIGAILIHQLPEAVGVMLFFQIGEFFQEFSISHSRRSIGALLSLRPDFARLKIRRGFEKIAPDKVIVGDIIIVKPGEKVPLDGIIIKGKSLVDTSALTGEGIPRTLKEMDIILAGMILKTGMLTIKVTKILKESSISRIFNLIETALHKKAKTEKFITSFARYYTPLVVLGAFFIAFLTPLLFPGTSFYNSICRVLVLLVISCPCALVLSIPLSYFGGIGKASKLGILIKGSNYLDILTMLKTGVFDKTGILTQGVFKVNKIVAENGFSEKDVLKLAVEAES